MHTGFSICESAALWRFFSKGWQSVVFQQVFLDVFTVEIVWNTYVN